MFEMFALLINLLILTISEAMVTCYLFFLYIHVGSSATQRIYHQHLLHYIFENLPWEFAAKNCRGYLPREFTAGIFRGNFSQQFSVAICHRFFVFVSKSFFVYGRKSCLYESKPFFICERNVFICEIFFITVFLFAIAVAVVGHRTKRF